MLEFDEAAGPGAPVIKVVGVGGGGGNAVNTMIEGGIEGVDFIVANTDCQVLEANQAPIRIQLGRTLTKGLGAGANPEIGRAAALEDAGRVAEALAGADMVFVTAGMGGGTGTGAAPVVAQVARDMGALTVGVVTRPFGFEGSQRKKKATNGVNELAKAVDALIVIPNDRLIALAGVKMTLKDAFGMVDHVLLNAVRGISDLVTTPGLVNVDFADVRTVMTGMGRALMGTGRASGDKRAIEAAKQAINSPLLEDVSINGATGILINVTAGPDLTLAEVNEACSLIEEAADPDVNIIFGSVIDANAGDEVRVTVIATGFQPQSEPLQPPPPSRKTTKPQNDQMALPNTLSPAQSGPMAAAPVAPAPVAVAPVAAGFAAPAPQPMASLSVEPASPPPAAEALAEPIEIDDSLLGNEYPPISALTQGPVPSSPMPLAPSAVLQAGSPGPSLRETSTDWPTVESRPIIRPPVGAGSALGRRLSGSMPAVGPQDELGVEESEWDKPAYLRRGLGAREG